jgi:hypothetical protein
MSQHEAYKERDYQNIKIYKSQYEEFLSFSQTLTNNFCTNYLIYPAFKNAKDADELLNKLLFSLPNETVTMFYSLATNEHLNNDKFVRISADEIDTYINEKNIIFHSMEHFFENKNKFNHANSLHVVDKYFFSDIEAETLRILYFNSLNNEQKESHKDMSRKNFKKFQTSVINKKSAFCFNSGPSFDTYKQMNFPKNVINIICNSIVKNSDFLNQLDSVDVITFADPVFHFGPSKYAQKFREDVVNVVKKYNSFIFVLEINFALILKHYPELKNNLIALSIRDTFNFPSQEKMYVKQASNILTLFMLPIASAVSDYIFIMGADGRESNENYFWKHSSSAQYDDLMESAFETHPSFFRDRDYEDYYEQHCETIEKLINFGEKSSKYYASITDSYIPSFKERKIDFSKEFNQICYELSDRKKSIKSRDNYDFALDINILFSYIDILKESNLKIALYGYGHIGKIFKHFLQEQVCVVFDKSSQDAIHPDNISKYEFDILVISVLGRELDIKHSLKNYTSNLQFYAQYHDVNIFNGYVNGKSLNYINKIFFDENFYSDNIMKKVQQLSIENLRAYEQKCDILASDIIKDHYGEKLFFTNNHPPVLCDKAHK